MRYHHDALDRYSIYLYIQLFIQFIYFTPSRLFPAFGSHLILITSLIKQYVVKTVHVHFTPIQRYFRLFHGNIVISGVSM